MTGIAGRRIALSVSDSDDLQTLGMVPAHLQLVLAELARVAFVGGASLVYGGDLRPGGHTDFLLHELGGYARARDALVVCLAWPAHRRTPVAELERTEQRLGLRGLLVALDEQGQPLADWRAGRPASAQPDLPAQQKTPAFLAMRRHVIAGSDARVVIGGRRRSDVVSGVLEETLLSLDAGQPVYLAGGYGGTALDIACAIDPACRAWRPPMAPPPAAPSAALLADIAARAQAQGGWALLGNGLDAASNLRLAATHRPSEIATLVAAGVARGGKTP